MGEKSLVHVICVDCFTETIQRGPIMHYICSGINLHFLTFLYTDCDRKTKLLLLSLFQVIDVIFTERRHPAVIFVAADVSSLIYSIRFGLKTCWAQNMYARFWDVAISNQLRSATSYLGLLFTFRMSTWLRGWGSAHKRWVRWPSAGFRMLGQSEDSWLFKRPLKEAWANNACFSQRLSWGAA